MSFKFAIRPATVAEAEQIFQLLQHENLFDGTLAALTAEISGAGSSTYWVAVKDGVLLGVLRAAALGPGFPRFIAVDQIALASALLRREIYASALEVVAVLLERALGDISAFAVATESTVATQPSALAIISKALINAGFVPGIAATDSEDADVVASSDTPEVGIKDLLAAQLGSHVLAAQVFIR